MINFLKQKSKFLLIAILILSLLIALASWLGVDGLVNVRVAWEQVSFIFVIFKICLVFWAFFNFEKIALFISIRKGKPSLERLLIKNKLMFFVPIFAFETLRYV